MTDELLVDDGWAETIELLGGEELMLYWSVAYVQSPGDHAFGKMVTTWSVLLLLCFVGLGLSIIKRFKIRVDPNLEDQQGPNREGPEPPSRGRSLRRLSGRTGGKAST